MGRPSGIVTWILFLTTTFIIVDANDSSDSGVPSAPPSEFLLGSVGLSSITVKWFPIPWHARNGLIILGYSVRYQKWESNEIQYLEVGSYPRTATLNNLEEGTKYIIQVAGFTAGGSGVYSAPLEVETEGGNPCDSDPCLNGGTCTVQSTVFQCTCSVNFTGVFCASSVHDPPCYSPNVSLPNLSPQDSSATVTVHRSKQFLILSDVILDCELSHKTAFTWSIYQTTPVNILVLSTNGTYDFRITPRLLAVGTYLVQLTVSMVGTQVFGIGQGYIKVNSSPLIALITGGTKVVRGFDRSLVLNASMSYDPDEENQQFSNLSFTWLCTNGQSPDANNSDSGGCFIASNESVVTINNSLLLENSSYFITAEISKDQRQAQYTQEVFISPGDPPEVQIRCVENCDIKLNPSSRIALQGLCEGSSCKGSPTYQWSIFRNTNISSSNEPQWVEISEIEEIVTTRLSSLSLVTFPGVLAPDMQYKFVLTAKRPGGFPGYSEYQVTTNSPPFGGDCQVRPASGVTLTTEFTFTCANWQDTDFPLQYEFIYFTNGDLLNVVDKGQQSSKCTKLPVGDKEKNFTIDFRVRVGDVFGAFTEVKTPVQVVEPKIEAGSMVNIAANLTTGNNSELTKLIQSGDLSGAVQLATAAIAAIDDDLQTVSSDELREKRTGVKSSILQQVSAVRAETVVRVQQLSNVIAEATSVITEVTVEAQEAATSALQAMTSVLKVESSAGETYEVLLDGARSLVTGLGSMLRVSSYGARIHDTKSHDVAHVQSSPIIRRRKGLRNGISFILVERQRRNTGHGEPDEKDKAKERAIHILQSLDDVGSTILSRTLVGEKSTELSARSVSVLVSREKPDVLAGSTFYCKGNSITFPSSAELFNTATKFVDGQVMTTDFLPFSWDHSGDRVTTGVSMVELRNSTGHVLNITDLKSPITLTIQNMKDFLNNSKRHYIGTNKTVYHKINVTLPGMALILKVRPESNSTDFAVFFKYQARPTSSNSDFNTTIPDYSSCVLGSFGYVNCSRDPYVVYIDSANVNQTGYHFVGIQIKSRTSTMSRKKRCSGQGRWKRSCVEFKEPPTTAPIYNVPEYLQGDENYTIEVLPAACLYWNTELSEWITNGCTVDDTTTLDSIHCSCNHLSAFGGQLFVAPNPIDFDLVFTEFVRLSETGNVAVIIAICCVFGLYLLLLVWARKFDKLDRLKLGTRSFLGMRSPWAQSYEIEVSTGIWRNSGTTAKVFIMLEGEQGTSRPYQLKSDSYIPFGRGSTVTFTLSIPIDIGPLRKLRLWHDNSGKRPSWFLNHIKIRDVSTREKLIFMCYTWLAVDKGDGLVDRTLTTASTTNKGIDFTVYVQNRIAEEFSDEHLWFSVATRSPRHRFTRVERLSCCLSLLLTIMLASAMFYQLDTGGADSQGTLQLGRFVFNLRDLIIGLQSLSVVMPFNILTVEIFMHTRSAKEEKQSQETPTETAAERREFALPHWCIYIAWLLCLLTAFVSATLIIFYSVQWDIEKSEEWLISTGASVLMDIFVSEPLKIVVVAFILSHSFKARERDPPQTRYQPDSVINVKDIPSSELDKQEEDVEVPKPPSKKQLRNARTNRMRELQMFIALRKIVSYIIYLLILMIVCYGGRNEHGFLMTSSMKNVFGELSVISSHADVWDWARNVLVPGLYEDGKHSTNSSPYIGDGAAVLVGMPRLRQLRVKKESCKVVSEAQRLFNSCVGFYSFDDEDRTLYYQPGWHQISLTGKKFLDNLEHICPSAWRYFSADQTKNLPFWGRAHIYSQGGYLAELGYDKNTALNVISELNRFNWIDRLTRVVFVEFTVFNPGVSLFSAFTIPFEFSPSGYIFTGYVSRTMYVYDLGGGYSAVTVLCQVLLVLHVIYFIITEMNQIIRGSRLYFTQLFPIVEITQTITVIAFVVTHVLKETELFINTAKLQRSIFQFISFDRSVFLDTLESGLVSVLMFVNTVKLLYLLKFNSHVNHLFDFMERSARELLRCSLGFLLFIFAFVHFGYLQFGQVFLGYSSPINAIQTLLLEGVIGGTHYFHDSCPIGRAYILVFKLSLHIICNNLFVAVIIEKYRIVRHLSKRKFNLGQFMIRKMKEILGCVREQPVEPQKETERKTQEVELPEVPVITDSTLQLMEDIDMRRRQIIRSLNENYIDDFGEDSDLFRLWLDLHFQRLKETPEGQRPGWDYCALA